jgi:hypothetical protein
MDMEKKLFVTVLCCGICILGTDLLAMPAKKKKKENPATQNVHISAQSSSSKLSRITSGTSIYEARLLEEDTGEEQVKQYPLSSYSDSQSIYLNTFFKELEPIINANLKQQLSNAFAGFVEALVKKIENEGIKDLSHLEFLKAHLKHEATFRYLRRSDRSEREQMALYTYADAAVAGNDGLFNKVKRNVLDEIYLLVGLYNALIEQISPDDLIEEEKFLQYMDNYVGSILDMMLSQVTGAAFSLLSELIPEPCCGCLAKTKLSYNERVQLASSAECLLKSVLKKFLDKDIVEGVAGCVDVFLSGKNEPSSIPVFKEQKI